MNKKTDPSLNNTSGGFSEEMVKRSKTQQQNSLVRSNPIEIPSITLPKGGGALKSIDEKFQVNTANGTSTFSMPLPFSKSRSGFGPSLSLGYNSGSGNSPFGLGWSCDMPSVQRKTDKKLPQYNDEEESDVFMFSGAEDLVPYLKNDLSVDEFKAATGEKVRRYRPRLEGAFLRIERIFKSGEDSFYWKVTSKDNVVTFFGRTTASRIADPNDASKVYKWLPDLSYDDKGNCSEYLYLYENLQNVPSEIHERNRLNRSGKFSNKYLKRIKYGNKNPYVADKTQSYSPVDPTNPKYFFETVFDYDDHNKDNPTPAIQSTWSCRTDSFSDYKPGFEIRTNRLCRRVLFFHYFKELSPSNIEEATLVRSVNLKYKHFKTSNEKYTEADFITAIQSFSFERNGVGSYNKDSLPPLEFTYQELKWSNNVEKVSAENLIHAPLGIAGNYQWIDFYGEGISGILHEEENAWYYKRNLGDGKFAKAEAVITKPSLNGISLGILQLTDIEANGKKYIVSSDAAVKGFYEQTNEEGWFPFKAFENSVNVNLQDPNLKFIDLNGDGMPDIIISEENVFTFYTSKGTKGFDEALKTSKPYDEEKGPDIIFSDSLQTIYLADMSGDGMTDIVRVRNSGICYWPNLGYGKFGKKISMLNAPLFDANDAFNPAYLHLFDISGTGATDLVYLGGNTFKAWLNQSGNAWSDAYEIKNFPTVELPNIVNVTDFKGNGTGCIVWSSSLPGYTDAPLRYIDLMGGTKPFILRSYNNNFGKTTSVEYKSSTYYYLDDKAKGKNWITKLPFPVQCVSKEEIYDEVSQLRFTSKYSYHHGYYDHAEREFRGFGGIEQTDTETFADFVKSGAGNITTKELHQPPVLTKTWYHTGAYFDREKILSQFENEYFSHPSFDECDLPEPTLSYELTAQEWREALRACKGMALRQEVYALDDTEKSSNPYSIASHNCQIQMLQPCEHNLYAVFLVNESETLTYQLERNIKDPRIAHSSIIEIDEFGNVMQSASVVYARKITLAGLPRQVQQEQKKLHIIYSKNNYTNDIDTSSAYRLRVPCESLVYELTGVNPNAEYFTIKELKTAFAAASDINYETPADGISKQKRKIEHTRLLFLNDDTSKVLPLYKINSLGINFESYRLVLNDSLRNELYGSKVDNTLLTESALLQSDIYKADARFPDTDANNEWWMRSGTANYPASPETHFYLPDSFTDPLNSITKVRYYSDYYLLVDQTIDALLNTSTVEKFDFRTMLPVRIKDINGVVSVVAIDVLGFVVGSAIIGKNGEGDNLTGFKINLTQAERDSFFNTPGTVALPLLGNATARFIYDFSRTNVATVAVGNIIRETHFSELNGGITALQMSFEYSDGLGHVIMKKMQADPGVARKLNNSNQVVEIDTGTNLRWAGNGRTIYNNKGNPIKQFEPFFSVTHKFENESGLVEIGVTSVMYYDAVSRLIKTAFPNGTFSKVEFDAWQQKTYDNNDTVNDAACQWYLDRTTGSLAGNTEEKDAAKKTYVHRETPTVTHLDSLGRTTYSIAHNAFIDRTTGIRTEEFHSSFIELDIENNQKRITDARDNDMMKYKHDMLGNVAYQESMDAGVSYLLNDCLGNPLYKWTNKDTSKEIILHFYYDLLHRPTYLKVSETGKSTIIPKRIEYGDATTGDYTNGQVLRSYDGSGIVTNEQFDFKSNILKSKRELCKQYDDIINWSNIASVTLRSDFYTTILEFDALNRPVKITTPDSSVFTPEYNRAAMLESMNVNVKGTKSYDFITNINYDEKGQHTEIFYGNGIKTRYTYDAKTFRVTRILSTRKSGTEKVQDLNYTYDPVGNITSIKDNAQSTVFFSNAVTEAHSDYTYDAVYRLIKATGREHAGNNAAVNEYDHHRMFHTTFTTDGSALQNYCQYYDYDEAGNILRMVHKGGNGCLTNRWTRAFNVDAGSNRLLSVQVGNDLLQNFTYNLHGSMISMGHLSELKWDYEDRLQSVTNDNGNTEAEFSKSYYTYDREGDRVRKIVEHTNGITEERIYQGAVEVYTKSSGNSVQLKRETLHVMDSLSRDSGNKKRVATVDTRIVENDLAKNEMLFRFQLDNHLGTACVELDESANANLISYEEYYPYGSTSYSCTRNDIEVPARRYRFTGMERDEETGLEYHRARYYLPWLGRWITSDPLGLVDGTNLYAYVRSHPLRFVDPKGTDSHEDALKYRVELIKEGARKLAGIEGGKRLKGFGAPVPVELIKGKHMMTEVNFDPSFWEPIIEDPSSKMGSLRLKKDKMPSVAIRAIFEHPEKWKLDCATFLQVVMLYARLNEANDDKKFDREMRAINKKTGVILLRPHLSTGLEFKHEWSFEEKSKKLFASDAAKKPIDPSVMTKRIAEAPLGSIFTFQNLRVSESHSFHLENTIFVAKSKSGERLFLAWGLSRVGPKNDIVYTEDQIRQRMAGTTGTKIDPGKDIRIKTLVYFPAP